MNEGDITKTYKKASELNLPYLIVSLGEPLKRLNNLIEAIRNLEGIEKIAGPVTPCHGHSVVVEHDPLRNHSKLSRPYFAGRFQRCADHNEKRVHHENAEQSHQYRDHNFANARFHDEVSCSADIQIYPLAAVSKVE